MYMQSFEVPSEVRSFYQSRGAAGSAAEASWNQHFAEYKIAHPELAAEFERRLHGQLPADWKDKLPKYSHTDGKAVATRNRSEEVLNAIASHMPEIMGGSADLTPSNLTSLKVCMYVCKHAYLCTMTRIKKQYTSHF